MSGRTAATPAQPGWYTLRELAALRGCTPDYLRQKIRRRTLPASKVGPIWVVARADAEALIAAPRRIGHVGSRYDHFAAACPHGADQHFEMCDLNYRAPGIRRQHQRLEDHHAEPQGVR